MKNAESKNGSNWRVGRNAFHRLGWGWGWLFKISRSGSFNRYAMRVPIFPGDYWTIDARIENGLSTLHISERMKKCATEANYFLPVSVLPTDSSGTGRTLHGTTNPVTIVRESFQSFSRLFKTVDTWKFLFLRGLTSGSAGLILTTTTKIEIR